MDIGTEIPQGNEKEQLSRLKVLQVEDEDILRRLVSRDLTGLGISHVSAESAIKAREIFNEDDSFNVLITDFDMPGMNGAELIRELKKKKPDLLTMLFSGRAEGDEDVNKYLGEHKYDFYETKPVDLSTLEERLKVFNKRLIEREREEIT